MVMENFILFVMVSLVMLVYSVQSANVLLITASSHSHCAEIAAVGQELADRGHNVSILLSATFNHHNCHLKQGNGTKQIHTILSHPPPDVMSGDEVFQMGSTLLIDGEDVSYLRFAQVLSKTMSISCAHVISDTKTILALKENKFEIIILDGLFTTYCYFVVPYVLKVPYVAVCTAFDDLVSGRPFLPSISPSFISDSTTSMTFFQRIKNTFVSLIVYAIGSCFMPMDIIGKLAPELSRSDVINLASKSELFLYNYDPILAYPVPKMPNHVFAGGLGLKPAQPLKGDIEKYYTESPNGIVLVTFGSNAMTLPRSKMDAVLRVLQKIKYNVLWKHGEEGQFGNVKQIKWLPQNDLLGHPKTKLFVSHCGNNGVFEALYHGVPLVCTPIIGDQPFNGARVQHWEVGVTSPLLKSTEDELYNSIMEVLNNPKYRKNMKRASEMYRSHSETPRQRAADAVENVLRFGGGHLRSRSSEMSVFTYMGYDIICFLLGLAICTGCLICKCLLLLYRRCCKTSAKEKIN